ncbi:MAG TPA: sulfite reductase subunit alpha [Methylomirabilota bacterium]|nr:sulfite reductase subunit alpha [Methylomirabilota bacterium]
MKSEANVAVPFVPATAPFNERQRAWLNGYFAGLTSFAGTEMSGGAGPVEAVKTKVALTILFGSQTGTAEGLAKRLAKESAQHGFAASVKEANACSVDELAKAERLLLLTSTWGEGDAPDNAGQLLAALAAEGAPKLEKLSFSVLALGDRNYSDFCGAGRKFDEALEKLGAKRIHPRVDCDLDYEAPAKVWAEAVLAKLSESEEVISETVISNQSRTSGDSAGAATTDLLITDSLITRPYSRKSPFPARLLVNRKLNGDESAKDTRHIAISLEGSEMTYEAGDALGVFPMNCPALVADILSALGCDGEEAVKAPDASEISLRHALLRHYQVTQPGSSLLEALAERAQSAELKTLLAPENKAALEKHLHGREVIDLLCEHRLARFTPEEFVALLRKLNPRLYSIASSLKAHPGEVHLCVGTVRYETLGRSRKGVCSTFLADRVDDATRVPVFVQTSHGFRPAEGDKPMIMVGPGTGIAPFRAFLEERKATGGRGKNWLFFGDQKRSCDFLYRGELETMFKEGTLTRLDTAFSRDQAEKVYVQTRMLEHAKELFAWLEEGAHFYVCGDAKRMAKDVDAMLHEIIQNAGGKTPEAAKEYVAQLKAAKRYQRDVY